MRCSLCGLCCYTDVEDDDAGHYLNNEEDSYNRPAPRWKAMLRRARRRLKRPKSQSFHYDALSYAMNFDERNW